MSSESYNPKDGFLYYHALAIEADLTTIFDPTSTLQLFQSLQEEQSLHRYAPGKWSIKEVIGHITDHERIKMFRAFQLSRREKVELWGYDQDALVRNAHFDELPLVLLIEDYLNVRRASQSFIRSLSEEQLHLQGSARKYTIRLESFLQRIIGHERHHLQILQERYL
ncbi:MAG: DinB family protein [Bacteroidota bacterium]